LLLLLIVHAGFPAAPADLARLAIHGKEKPFKVSLERLVEPPAHPKLLSTEVPSGPSSGTPRLMIRDVPASPFVRNRNHFLTLTVPPGEQASGGLARNLLRAP
jgi:hypothetical protein